MKLLTTAGTYATVKERGYPLAGMNTGQTYGQGWSSIALSPLPSGENRLATYALIYKTNPWAWTCVNLIAKGLSRFPLKVYRLLADGERERVRGDLPGQVGRPTAGQQLDNLLHHPAPRVSRQQWVRRMATDALVYGNCMSVAEKGPFGVQALWHTPWRRVNVKTGDQVPILTYDVTGNLGQPKSFIPEDVIHLGAGTDPEAPIGASPMQPLKFTLALYDAMQRHLVAFFGNQARLSGHLKVDKGTGKDKIELIREAMRQLYMGPENAGNVLITSAEWQQISAAPGQTDIVELAKLAREEICACYGVPPPVAGILERAIKSNVKELREQYVRDAIGPWAEWFEQELEAQLLPMSSAWQYHFVEFEMGEVLRPDLEARAQAYKMLESTYTVNERRGLDNLAKLEEPEADTVWMPSGAIPLGIGTPASVGDPASPDDEPTPPADDELDDDEEDDEEDL